MGQDMKAPITLAEAIHIYENSRLQSEHFTQEALTAAYALGLSGLYALQAMGDLRREHKKTVPDGANIRDGRPGGQT